MQRIGTLTAVCLLLLSCQGKNSGDDRVFGSLNASFSSSDSGQGSDDAVVVPTEDTLVIDKDVDGGFIDNLGKGETGKGEDSGNVPPTPGKETPAPGKETPAPGKETPKTPELPKELKDKLAKCWPQWEKAAAGEKYEIREVIVNVDKLKKSNIQLTGDKPEVVFVTITSASSIEKVKLALDNAKGLYCLDIKAEKGIENLDIAYVCGAKLGLVDIEGGKAKKVNIREVCNKPS